MNKLYGKNTKQCIDNKPWLPRFQGYRSRVSTFCVLQLDHMGAAQHCQNLLRVTQVKDPCLSTHTRSRALIHSRTQRIIFAFLFFCCQITTYFSWEQLVGAREELKTQSITSLNWSRMNRPRLSHPHPTKKKEKRKRKKTFRTFEQIRLRKCKPQVAILFCCHINSVTQMIPFFSPWHHSWQDSTTDVTSSWMSDKGFPSLSSDLNLLGKFLHSSMESLFCKCDDAVHQSKSTRTSIPQ